MIALIASLNVATGLALAYLKWSRGSPFFVFFAVILSLSVVPAYLEPIGTQKHFHDFANPVLLHENLIIDSQFFIFIFLASFLILEVFIPAPKKRVHPLLESEGQANGILLALPLLSFLLIALGFVIFGSAFRYIDFATARDGGVVNIFSLAIGYLALLSAPLPAIFLRSQRFVYAGVSFLALLIPIVVFGASRQPLVISLLALAFLSIWKFRRAEIMFAIIVIAMLPAADLLLGAIKVVRNLPDLGSRIAALSDLTAFSQAADATSEDSAVRYIYYLILDGAQIEHAGEFRYLLRTCLFWLPGALDVFDIKPADFEADIFTATMGGRNGTMHPTVFGAIFADSGWIVLPWVFFIFIYMRGLELAMRRFGGYSAFLFFFGFYPSVMMARGSLYAPVFVSFVVFLLALLLATLKKKRP